MAQVKILPLSKLVSPMRAAKRPPTDPQVKLISNLRLLRRGRNISLRDAAKASRISPATLSRIELGYDPDLATALRAAAFYEKPVEQIWRLK
jgi:DNA-binding XRE family transcriptional regulator